MIDRVIGRDVYPTFPRRVITFRHPGEQLNVVLAIPGLVEMEFFEQFLFAQVRKNQDSPAEKRPIVSAVHDGGGKVTMRILVEVQGQRNPPQISGTSCRSFPGAIYEIAQK